MQAGDAAQQFGVLAQTTNGVLAEDVKPAMANLNKAIMSAQRSADTLNAAVGDDFVRIGFLGEHAGTVREFEQTEAYLSPEEVRARIRR